MGYCQSQHIPVSRIRDSSVAKDQLLRNDTREEFVIPNEPFDHAQDKLREEESLKGIWWKILSSGK